MEGDLTFNSGLLWVLTIIVFPAFAYFWKRIDNIKKDALDEMAVMKVHFDAELGAANIRSDQVREKLEAYKLEVAKDYATNGYLKDVESRLTRTLERIERKLDGDHCAPAE